MFVSVGQTLTLCSDLKGIRIVDTSSKGMFRCRFEIWMNYREDDDNLEKIKKHFEELLKTLQSSEINVQNMKFFNISKTPILANTQADKKPELEKTQSENKNN